MRPSRPVAVALALLAVAAIGWVELRLDEELSVGLFYVFPVVVAAWTGGSFIGALFAGLVSLSWTLAVPDPHPAHDVWNLVIRALFFLTVAAAAAHLSGRYHRARVEAQSDPLTGLANRRAFVAALDRALDSRAHPITVVYLDVDDFKGINDRRGHPGGDLLLQEVADTLRTESRGGDLPARLGGDEFGLLLVGVPTGLVLQVVDRVLTSARSSGASLSAGAFTVGEEHRSAEAVLANADRLMYEVKRSGKGRVVMRAA